MTKYEELKAAKIKTVKQLIEALAKLPEDTIVQADGADIGGYDVIQKDFCIIYYDEVNKTVAIASNEAELYEAYEKKQITREQYCELNESEY